MHRSKHCTSIMTSGSALSSALRLLVILIVLVVGGQFAYEQYQARSGGGGESDTWQVETDFLDIESGACGDQDRSIEAAWEISANGQDLSTAEDLSANRGRRSGRVTLSGKSYTWNSLTDPRLRIAGWVCDLDSGSCGWMGQFSAEFQVRGGRVEPKSGDVERLSGGRFAIPVPSLETACEMSVVVRFRAR